jgi:hypothetical protein
MENRGWNIVYMAVGLVCLLISVPQLFHHHYEYFDSFEGGWVPYLAFFLAGAWFVVFGLIGLVRVRRGKRSV